MVDQRAYYILTVPPRFIFCFFSKEVSMSICMLKCINISILLATEKDPLHLNFLTPLHM